MRTHNSRVTFFVVILLSSSWMVSSFEAEDLKPIEKTRAKRDSYIISPNLYKSIEQLDKLLSGSFRSSAALNRPRYGKRMDLNLQVKSPSELIKELEDILEEIKMLKP
ncbi:hypothetical protein HELRODRAFT_179308 [Helobdella robusta]|uniref:Uncharacterized protein n=1 Tax=Helobdella robusta TaxID=6412 RepID=T1FEI8_HELRO|nr:hypothetical protein HELRODRAFT_179308 [Helobdella robusta]ESN95533.1 hypothetical protein HELRODRAFT_179308 [Helobdella robusta]